MLEKTIIITSELFKASGSFWALSIAHQLFLLGLQRGGWYMFFYPIALFLVCIAFWMMVDCGINVYNTALIDIPTEDDGTNNDVP